MRGTTIKWICDAVRPHLDGYETHFYSSERPPIEADEYDRICAEAADLRRQLAAVPVDAISDLYDAHAYAVAGMDNGEEFPAVREWLATLPAK